MSTRLSALRSIRIRLTLASMGIVSVFGVLLGLVARGWIEADLREGLRSFAGHEMHELSSVVGAARTPADLAARREALDRLFPEDGVVSLAIWTWEGELALGYPDQAELHAPWPEGLAAARAGQVPWQEEQIGSSPPHLRTAAPITGPEGPAWIVVAAVRTDHVESSLQGFTRFYGLGLLVFVGLGALGAYVLVSQALTPVLSLVGRAKQIAAEGEPLGRLEALPAGSELAELVQLINQLLAKADETVDRLRRFTAHAGHELRTPLSRMRGEVEQALRVGTPEEAVSALHGVLEEVDVQRQVLDALLELAHSGERFDLSVEPPIDLSALAEEILEEGALLLEDERELVAEITPDVMIQGHRALIARALWNLFHNATAYSPAGSRITIRVGVSAEGLAQVEVGNSLLPGMAPLSEAHFEPFARGDLSGASREGHHGLGLALTRAIASRHGGTLGGASRPDGTVSVRLELPCAPAD